ncbi:ComF family protein [Planococcus sp. YIM B11945]|uniref:ComF family protein n=1 Tax=Planococcus sp. YIM B11945 TaxID=3435410 RepID=UPI003D7F0CF8
MDCYLCGRAITVQPSWRGIFLNELTQVACSVCQSKFEKISGDSCPICGFPGEGMCPDCRVWETTEYAGLIQSGNCLYRYNEAMQDYLHQYKFLQDVVLAEVFAAELHKTLKPVKSAIVPIPMHPEKLKARTFSQVDCLLAAAGLPFTHLLKKSETVQGKKSKQERLSSAALFSWDGKEVPEKVILVDDLYTTGTTMRHAAKALKEGGAKEIHLFSLIRG